MLFNLLQELKYLGSESYSFCAWNVLMVLFMHSLSKDLKIHGKTVEKFTNRSNSLNGVNL